MGRCKGTKKATSRTLQLIAQGPPANLLQFIGICSNSQTVIKINAALVVAFRPSCTSQTRAHPLPCTPLLAHTMASCSQASLQAAASQPCAFQATSSARRLIGLKATLPKPYDSPVPAAHEPLVAPPDTWQVSPPTRPRAPPPPPPSLSMPPAYNRPTYSSTNCYAPKFTAARQPRPLDASGKPLSLGLQPQLPEAFDEHGLDSPGGIHALNEDLARGMYHPTLNSEDASSSRHNAYHVDYAVHPTLKPRLPPVLPSATVSIDGSPHISQLDSRRKDLANFATGHVFLETFSSPETDAYSPATM